MTIQTLVFHPKRAATAPDRIVPAPFRITGNLAYTGRPSFYGSGFKFRALGLQGLRLGFRVLGCLFPGLFESAQGVPRVLGFWFRVYGMSEA